MDAVDATRFNEAMFRLLAAKLPRPWWRRPFQAKGLRRMEAYVAAPASNQWFLDANNFLAFVPAAPGVLDLRLTAASWVAGFRQDADVWITLILEFVLEWLLGHLGDVLAALDAAGVFGPGLRVAAWVPFQA